MARVAEYKFTLRSLTIALQNSLFSSVVAAFIIETYKSLQPTNGQNPAGGPPSGALRTNIVLFLSFFLSMMSAVGCALVQQWCDEYMKFAYPRAAPHARGRVRTYLLRGLKDFHMLRFMSGIHALLHTSVFLFFWALSDFFYNVHPHFGTAARYALIGPVTIYILLSVHPLISINSPYNTPMSPLLRTACIILRIICRFPMWLPQWILRREFDLTGLPWYKGIHFDRAHLYSMEAGTQAKTLEPFAMEWLFTDNDFSDSDMDKFLESLPGYVSSNHTEKDQLDKYLTAEHITNRIKGHLITCATSVEVSDEESITRVFPCVKALLLIFEYSRKHSREQDKTLQSQQIYIQDIIDNFQTLCASEAVDPTMALRASCIRSLAVHGLLSQIVSTACADKSHFPLSLIPLYDLFFPNNKADTGEPEEKVIWKAFLHDAPLANLTMLAKAVRKKEHAPPSSLSFCWKTFDILQTQFGTIHFDASSDNLTRAQGDFDYLHTNIRKYVHGEEMGFRMTPLLETLDIVDRGRRLLMVFSSRPKYHSRATVVYGKEYLRNVDLLEAFAHCLPSFVAKNSKTPKACMDLMEKVVSRDYLWSNLQMALSNSQTSTTPTSVKFRVFECCCNVLDAAFSILEDSRKVDWRAPEFGSLWQHFESFITHGFQGAFMGRAASFRIGIIKARFCKVLLAQFCKNILSFRSQWDVASLAKLINYLGLRDEDDPEFWNSYFKGGHIGAEFTAKALKMANILASDGPLSIFCQLGHLITSTIPSHHSGLERKDIEKVLEIQDRLVEDKRLPLNGASDSVWEDLDRLREQVLDLYGATASDTTDTGDAGDAGDEGDLNADEEGELLKSLLWKIDEVCSLRVTSSESPSRSEHVGGQPRAVSQGETCLLISRASINLQPESPAPTFSSSHSTVQSIHIGAIEPSSFSPRGRIDPGSPTSAAGQNPQRVTSGRRRNTLIALANPIISISHQ